MRATGLLIFFAAIVAIQAASAPSSEQVVKCQDQQHVNLTSAPASAALLEERAASFCAEAVTNSYVSIDLSKGADGLAFTIAGVSAGTEASVEDCRQRFRNIVSACCSDGVLNGGEITAKNITYSITLDEKGLKHEGNLIEARARGGSKTRTRRPAAKRPATKRPATKRPATKHPATKRPATKRPATKRPGPGKRPNRRPTKSHTQQRPTKTASKNATPTPSKPVKTNPLKTCEQLHLELEKYEQRLAQTSGVDQISSRRSPRSELFTRGRPKKPGTGPCNVDKFWSNDYESFGVEIRENRFMPIFGYKDEKSCADYSWYPGDTSPALKASLPKNSGNRYQYETEHVLEWNTVVEFFHIYLDRKFVGKKLPSEDPLDDFKVGSSATGAKVRGESSYCKAWSKTWGNWPQDQHFKLTPKGPSRTPFQHIADVYPSSAPEYKREEFTGLQRSLNGLKLRFFQWTEKPVGLKLTDTWKPEPRQLYDEKGMKKGDMPWLIVNDPGAALLRIRNVLGVRRYLESDKVRKALKDVKIRLQERFDEIETALADPANARVINADGPTRNNKAQTARKLHPWEPQNLGTLWDDYMNKKWEMARRHENFIRKWENELHKRYCLPKHRKDTVLAPNDSAAEKTRKKQTADLCPKLDKFKIAKRAAFSKSTKFSAPWKDFVPVGRKQRPQNDEKFRKPKHPKKVNNPIT